jgi:hypothetical protein
VAFIELSVTPKRVDLDSNFRPELEAVPSTVFRRRSHSRLINRLQRY